VRGLQVFRIIKEKIVNLIKTGKIVSVDDSKNLRFGVSDFLGKEQNINVFTPYGLMHNPPVGSLVVMWASQAQESKIVSVSDDPQNRTLKNLLPGEVAIGNYETGDYAYFKANGDLEVKVTQDINGTVGRDVNLEIGRDANVDIGRDAVVEVANNVTATVDGNVDATIGGILDATVTGVATIESLASITLKAPVINLVTPVLNVAAAGGGAATSTFTGDMTNTQGDFTLQNGDLTLDSGKIDVTGGDITTDQDVKAGIISLSSHLHTGVTTGASNTGGPI
jgi:phage gp45-like